MWRLREIIEAAHPEWETNTTYAQNDEVRFGGNVYRNTTAGNTNGGKLPPVHTDGDEAYGSITWKFLHSGTGSMVITAVASATSATATVQTKSGFLPKAFVGSSGASTRWSEGAFSGVRGFPRAVAFYEERLYFAGTTHQPQTVFGSVSADFENHSPGTNDDDAVSLLLHQIR